MDETYDIFEFSQYLITIETNKPVLFIRLYDYSDSLKANVIHKSIFPPKQYDFGDKIVHVENIDLED